MVGYESFPPNELGSPILLAIKLCLYCGTNKNLCMVLTEIWDDIIFSVDKLMVMSNVIDKFNCRTSDLQPQISKKIKKVSQTIAWFSL
jgi:hypothetical protein